MTKYFSMRENFSFCHTALCYSLPSWQKFRENDFIIKKLLTYPQCGKVLSKHYHAEKNSVKSHNKNLQNLSLLDNGWFSILKGHFWVIYTKWILDTTIHIWFHSEEHFFELVNIIGEISYHKLVNFEGNTYSKKLW